MDDLFSPFGIQMSGYQRSAQDALGAMNATAAAQLQRAALMNRSAPPLSHIEKTAKYFRDLGLTDDQIRKAMTRACFEVLKNERR